MSVAIIDRGRDAVSARPRGTERTELPMQLQFTTPALGDPRLPSRFWDRVLPQLDGCWLWAGGIAEDGYSLFSWQGLTDRAHRVAFTQLIGSVPGGLQLDHLCRTRACVNPSHLEPVTRRENIMRGVGVGAMAARQTHCLRGHPFSEANTLFAKGRRRQCRACHTIRQARRRCRLDAQEVT